MFSQLGLTCFCEAPETTPEADSEVLFDLSGAWAEERAAVTIVGVSPPSPPPLAAGAGGDAAAAKDEEVLGPSSRARPGPLTDVDRAPWEESGASDSEAGEAPVASALEAAWMPGEAPRPRADLSRVLQEETVDSILGYATPKDPMPPRPMLLGRHQLADAAGSESLIEVKKRAAMARRQQALRVFLVSSGFKHVNEKKQRNFFTGSHRYPLHAAVTANDAEAIDGLLWGGADRAAMDSRRRSPLTLAHELNKNGSHAKVIALLES